jgi:hypothetical protein
MTEKIFRSFTLYPRKGRVLLVEMVKAVPPGSLRYILPREKADVCAS